jgi:hypothetical protein
MSIARQLYEIFYEGCTHYSVARTNRNGGLAYYTEEGIPSLAQITEHIEGKNVIGAYTILPGNTVRWMAFDVDAKDLEEAKKIAKKICDFLGPNIRYIVQSSGGKGYHIILIFVEPVPAAEAKAVGDGIRDKLGLPKTGDPHVEVYPKQDRLTPSNPHGNLLRLPCGFHPVTGNRSLFIDPYNGWESGPIIEPEEALGWRVDIADLKKLLEDQDPREQVIVILQPFWVDGERHNMSLYTSGFLAAVGWSEEAVESLIEELAENSGGGDIENQLECVRDTFAKYRKGDRIIGSQGLADILPANVMRQLVQAASAGVTTTTLQTIDSIRLGKGQIFQKVRLSATTILTYFKERGKLVRDANNIVYWLNQDDRTLLRFEGETWHVFMHSNFGLNPSDNFSKQVLMAVILFALNEADLVSVHKRDHWDGYALRINLGGPEVYVLEGVGKIRVILNGEENCLFLNTEDSMCLPNLMDDAIKIISPWKYLVDDVNYKSGSDQLASPAQQRELLAAFIICTFFASAMPTRPILAFLANSGSGKTTAARRILRLLEGPSEDVLSLAQDKPDSLRTSIVVHKIIALDNLEKTKAHWLTDLLNRMSTGTHIEIRKLFKTNEVHKIVPNCFLILTATTMPFSEETVFTRMLPIELTVLSHPMPENIIRDDLYKNYNSYWKGLLYSLDEVVKELKENLIVEAPNESRLADFTVFCSRIKGVSFINGEELMGGLNAMVAQQRQALQQSSPFIQVLESWMRARPEDAAKFMTMAELFTTLQRFANVNRLEWRWTNGAGLSRHIDMLEGQLTKHFGMSIRKVKEGGREVKKYKFEKDKLQVN